VPKLSQGYDHVVIHVFVGVEPRHGS
jgi:hypothetical protein